MGGMRGFLVVVRTHFVGHSPAEVKKHWFIRFLYLQVEYQELQDTNTSTFINSETNVVVTGTQSQTHSH
jgi:hypothetical protein